MKRGKRKAPKKTRQDTRTTGGSHLMKPDRLIKEVEEDNERISNPEERERVIPSKPC